MLGFIDQMRQPQRGFGHQAVRHRQMAQAIFVATHHLGVSREFRPLGAELLGGLHQRGMALEPLFHLERSSGLDPHRGEHPTPAVVVDAAAFGQFPLFLVQRGAFPVSRVTRRQQRGEPGDPLCFAAKTVGDLVGVANQRPASRHGELELLSRGARRARRECADCREALVAVQPRPIEIWLGGNVPRELKGFDPLFDAREALAQFERTLGEALRALLEVRALSREALDGLPVGYLETRGLVDSQVAQSE